jgi:deoxyribose-phosphate aldolase
MLKLFSYLDLANHHADATPDQIKTLCQNVLKYKFNAAFVNPLYVPLVTRHVPRAKVGTVISFPLGQDALEIKLAAAKLAATDGADELDVSANVALFKTAAWDKSQQEMTQIISVAKTVNPQIIVKFIIETGYLTTDEIKQAALAVLNSGADFVKICSGLGPRGATLEDVKTIREAIGHKIKLKVAGGISTYKQAVDFITAGADRIGTSKAIEIVSSRG